MPHSSRLAIVPGSFDPLTNGHVDLVHRAAGLFDRVIVALLVNAGKQPLFSLAEREAMARAVFADVPGVEVDAFDGLLVEYARRRGAHAVVRGVQSAADLDYEAPMARMNRHLASSVDTVFLLPSEGLGFISSRLVKEVAGLGGAIDALVPPAVAARMAERSARTRTLKA